jgi:hypothetical protein
VAAEVYEGSKVVFLSDLVWCRPTPSTGGAECGKMLAVVMAKPFLHCHHRFKNGKDHCYWSIAEKVHGAGMGAAAHPLFGRDQRPSKGVVDQNHRCVRHGAGANPSLGVVSGGSGGARTRQRIRRASAPGGVCVAAFRGSGARAGWDASCGIS